MPKICESCGFYSEDNAPTACPTCGNPVKLTLLAPRGQARVPLAESPRPRLRRDQTGFTDVLGIDPKLIGIGVLVLVGIGMFAFRQYEKRNRLEKVQPGMHISEAAKLMDTGRGMHHPARVRLRDRFSPDDTSSGTITYQDGGIDFLIRWENGIVVSVENKGGDSGGMRRRLTTITEDEQE